MQKMSFIVKIMAQNWSQNIFFLNFVPKNQSYFLSLKISLKKEADQRQIEKVSTRGGFCFYYNKLIKLIVFHLSWWHSLKLSFFSNITLIKCATNIKEREVDFEEFFLLNRKSFDLCHNNFFFYGEILSIKLHNMKHILLYGIVVLSIVLILAIPSHFYLSILFLC